MARKKNNSLEEEKTHKIHPDTKASVIGVILIGISIIIILSGIGSAGPVGKFLFAVLKNFLGWGYLLIPFILVLLGLNLLTTNKKRIIGTSALGSLLFIVAGLGLIDIALPGSGGILGSMVGSFKNLLGNIASSVLAITAAVSGMLIAFNTPLNINFKKLWKKDDIKETSLPKINEPIENSKTETVEPKEEKSNKQEKIKEQSQENEIKNIPFKVPKNYVLPPLSLLRSTSEKPTVGDLRANANIIKRTLESFGIPVEMGEITIGPKVTRYTLKPAEGVKLNKITALSQDLSLALAAHPIRIEAPIPGKSLVGIEIPNKVASIVRLGSLLNFDEFKTSGTLGFSLGRDVSGDPIFANIAKMPHLLIAGATGSGKSIAIHSIIMSLLFKNSPETLKLILIDPKRVELSVYEGLPHLITPIITEGKKSVAALRFALSEMETRYQRLLESGNRDIQSYNVKNKEPMSYILIVIDELADLMAAYGREIEGLIVRLAQMARATGIHLVVATQRPSVEVITGLIKANITSRVALQVASQVDSRTILDSAGAEKLLGGGDMLFVSAEISKPKRIQGAYVTDDEIKSVVEFIKTKNNSVSESSGDTSELGAEENTTPTVEQFMGGDEEDELFIDAVNVVREAKKASASLLQRRLRVGYARAARLLDIMEAKEIIGPGDGAKPREVFLDNLDEIEN